MLQNNVAPNVGQKLSSNQWPIILGARLYTTFHGQRVLVVTSHQVQCIILTFEALLQKNVYLFLEQCIKSNNVWLHALMQTRMFIFVLIL